MGFVDYNGGGLEVNSSLSNVILQDWCLDSEARMISRRFVVRTSESKDTGNSMEAIVAKNLVFADVMTKAVYFCMAAAVLLFVSMLLLTRLH